MDPFYGSVRVDIGTSKSSCPQTNTSFWWLSGSSSESENEANSQRKAIESHLFIFLWVTLPAFCLFCYYNEYHSLFFPRAKFGNYHAWSSPWTPQADIIQSSLSGYIFPINRTETYKVEQRESQGLKMKINNKHEKWVVYLLINENMKSISHL